MAKRLPAGEPRDQGAGRTHNTVNGGTFVNSPVIQTETAYLINQQQRRPRSTAPAVSRERLLDFARQVGAAEGAECNRLLGRSNYRIPLDFVRVTSPGREAAHIPQPTFPQDDLPDIVRYFRSLEPQRLVITGVAGAGKSLLAMDLLIGLVNSREDYDLVPVRIPLTGWNTRTPLSDHLRAYLVTTYYLSPRRARELVERGALLPVLDGLDEMDPPLPNGRPDPAAPRARDALKQLNAYQFGLQPGPLVLTCRAEAYDALAKGAAPDEARQLLDAAQIRIQRVEAQAARDYLTARAPDTARWSRLLDHLSAKPEGVMARLLSTPWRLCLAATVYGADRDPGELLGYRSAEKLDRHLLTHYLPAVTRTESAPGIEAPPRYPPEQVHRWLHWLAQYLDASATHSEPQAVAYLDQLWRFRYFSIHVRFWVIALLNGALPLIPLLLPLHHSTFDFVVTPFSFGTLGMIMLYTKLGRRPRTLRLASSELGRGTLLVLGAGAAVCWYASIAVHISHALVFALVTFVTLAAHFSLTVIRGNVQPPRMVIRDDALVSVFCGLPSGAVAVLGYQDLHDTLILGAVEGLYLILTMFGGASQLYLVFLLCSRRVLPFRLARFLDWATALGLLRLAGPGYQFRHKDLQDWLAAHPTAPSAGARAPVGSGHVQRARARDPQ